MASATVIHLRGSDATPVVPRPRPVIDWFGDGSLVVVDLAMACCAIESEFAVPAGALHRSDVPEGARVVVVVSGTVTDLLAPEVAAVIAGLPGPHVVAFGSCACAGGPYWDAYCVTKGIDQWVPVDTYVPGCPPPPRALAEVVDAVRGGRRPDAPGVLGGVPT
ncbi:MAG: proton-conducting membrane transporter [Propionibacterium sp.]|nr:proton-conducting membrane transporter [Propionibacterium sp.]